MSLPQTDVFTRANAATLGANWALAAGHGNWVGVQDNAVDTTGTGGRSGARWAADTPANDQYAQCTVTANPNGTGGVEVRSKTSGAARYYYGGGHDIGDFSSGVSRIWKEVNNTLTSLMAGPTTIAAGQTLYLEVKGSTLIFKINGVQDCTATDTDNASGGGGLYIAHTVDDVALFDNFEVGEFATAGGGAARFALLGIGAVIAPAVWRWDRMKRMRLN